jgi:hypothetical protein
MMGRVAWLWPVLVLACAACLHSDEEECSDGRVCPAGSTCDVAHDRCISPASVAACDGLPDGSGCAIGDQPGACRAGACNVFSCGNGIVEADEQCDGSDFGHVGSSSGSATCLDFDFYGAAGLECDANCMFVLDGCYATEGYCGDDKINGQELCDGTTDETCTSIGFDAGALECTKNCGLTVEACSHFGWNAEPLGALIANAVAANGPFDQFAVGAAGAAAQYDGFWRNVSSPFPNDLVGVAIAGSDDVWAVAAATTNGQPSFVAHYGASNGWTTIDDAPTGNYVDIYAAGANAVFAAADTGVQAWDGSAWSTLAGLPGEPIAIRGTSPADLWVATDGGSGTGPLEHWDGQAWTAQALGDTSIHFISTSSPTDVWAIGNGIMDPELGVIAHYDGAQWTEWTQAETFYNNVASTGPRDAWIAVSDDTMLHFDGTSWLHTDAIGASPSGLAAISGLVAIDGDEVLAVSTLHLAYRYAGQAFGGFPTLPNFAIPNPRTQTAIWGDSSANQFVTNTLGEVVHWNGVEWDTVFTIAPLVAGDSVSATWVWGAGGGDVWVSASDGRVFHATDGATFVDTNLGASSSIDVLWGDGPDDVWAFGIDGVFRFHGGMWATIDGPTGRALSASGSGPDDVWEITDDAGGTLRQCNSTGCADAPNLPATGQPLRAVIAVDPETTYVAAGHGRILHRNGNASGSGSDAWTVDVVATKDELSFFAASGPSDVTVASEVDMFHNDGQQWSPLRTPVDFVPNTENFIPIAGLQAAVGRLDLLLQTSRVRSLLLTRPITCAVGSAEGNTGAAACTDGVDNNCDGTIDNCL